MKHVYELVTLIGIVIITVVSLGLVMKFGHDDNIAPAILFGTIGSIFVWMVVSGFVFKFLRKRKVNATVV